MHRFGSQTLDACEALAKAAPVDLRVNPSRTSREPLRKSLSEAGAGRLFTLSGLPLALRQGPERTRPFPYETTALFHSGGFEIQDAGSQWTAQLAASLRPRRLLDLCAGAGGKTLALSAHLGDQAELHAFDRDAHRLKPLMVRSGRAGVEIAIHEPGVKPSAPRLSALEAAAPFDMVFVDAPCSGSGIWRRRPLAKWRLRQSALDERKREQDSVLDLAHRLVAPNGHLIYVTCSLFDEENDERIRAFLVRHRRFETVAPEHFVLPDDVRPLKTQFGLLFCPHATQTDGFYFACLKRYA